MLILLYISRAYSTKWQISDVPALDPNVIATGQTSGLTSKKTLRELDLSGSTVMEAIRVLEQKDYIEDQGNSLYKIIDPLIKTTLIFYMTNS